MVTLPLYTEEAFPPVTRNLRKPQMASEVKPPNGLFVNNIKNTNKQAKKQQAKTDWSEQIYVHIHIKKRAVSGVGEGVGEWGERGGRFGQLDKPHIFAIQGSYRGCHGGRPRTDKVRRRGGAKAYMYVHLFLGAWVVRGGVTGRPEFTPPYWYLAFFSEGFRIWNEHMRDSSTLIMPPALSNSPQ